MSRLLILAALASIALAQQPSLEVASIKENKSPTSNGTWRSGDNGRFTGENIPVEFLIMTAFKLKESQLTNLPPWADSLKYDLDVKADGKVTFQIPQEEMGQGVYTSLSQLLADELDVPFDQVTPLPAPPIDAVYGSPRSHRMGTGGSQSIRSFYYPLRQVGASGRATCAHAGVGLERNTAISAVRAALQFASDPFDRGRRVSRNGANSLVLEQSVRAVVIKGAASKPAAR